MFSDLADTVTSAIRFAYSLKRKNKGKSIPVVGLDSPGNAGIGPGSHCLSAENLAYSDEDQGRDALEEIVGVAIRLGIEQGRRIEFEANRHQDFMLKTILSCSEPDRNAGEAVMRANLKMIHMMAEGVVDSTSRHHEMHDLWCLTEEEQAAVREEKRKKQEAEKEKAPAPEPAPLRAPVAVEYTKGMKVKVTQYDQEVLAHAASVQHPIVGTVGKITNDVAPTGKVCVAFIGKVIKTYNGGSYLDVTNERPIRIYLSKKCVEVVPVQKKAEKKPVAAPVVKAEPKKKGVYVLPVVTEADKVGDLKYHTLGAIAGIKLMKTLTEKELKLCLNVGKNKTSLAVSAAMGPDTNPSWIVARAAGELYDRDLIGHEELCRITG